MEKFMNGLKVVGIILCVILIALAVFGIASGTDDIWNFCTHRNHAWGRVSYMKDYTNHDITTDSDFHDQYLEVALDEPDSQGETTFQKRIKKQVNFFTTGDRVIVAYNQQISKAKIIDVYELYFGLAAYALVLLAVGTILLQWKLQSRKADKAAFVMTETEEQR